MADQMLKSAPHNCLQCGEKLGRPVYSQGHYEGMKYIYSQWHIDCEKCNTFYRWEHPNVWVEHHPLALFERALVLPQLYDFYGKKIKKSL